MSASVDTRTGLQLFPYARVGTNNTFTVERAVPSQSVEVGGLLPLPEHGATPWDPRELFSGLEI